MKHLGLLGLIVMLSACGTIEGVGEDVSAASRTVQSWF